MDDIDGTKARQGRGNMQWSLSDKTTQYRYHQWYSNSWESGKYMRALASNCGASQINTTVASKVAVVTSKSECEKAAWLALNGVWAFQNGCVGLVFSLAFRSEHGLAVRSGLDVFGFGALGCFVRRQLNLFMYCSMFS